MQNRIACNLFPQKNRIPKAADVIQKDTTPGLQLYSKYDFVPGETGCFFDHFSQDNVGDFPALWNTNGSAEIVTRVFIPVAGCAILAVRISEEIPLKLPENYTIEFDVVPIKGEEDRMAGYGFRLMQCINVRSWDGGAAKLVLAAVLNISDGPITAAISTGKKDRDSDLPVLKMIIMLPERK